MNVPQRAIAVQEITASEAFQQALAIAAEHADEVDRRGRFPSEAVDALRSAGALGWGVPHEYGGAGAEIDDLSDATFELSRRCAATGMIFAMHQIQIASIARHLGDAMWFRNYLRRVVREQRLIASATSEVGVGGDLRKSIAAIEPVPDSPDSLIHFEKKASTISYGAHADDLLTTLRCSPVADPGDQVLVLTHFADMEAKPTGEWDTLGMRGTCSPGFVVRATCPADQVLPVPFAAIAAETMVPFSHILWAHVWLGIATDAFSRAQNFVRGQPRQNPGTTPPSALRLSELSVRMAEFRALVHAAMKEYMSLPEGAARSALSTIGYAVRINNLKIAASEAAVEACQAALRICGFLGYGNCSPYSVGRQLRDAHSAPLMIANDRLHATNAALLLVYREGK
ncbi:MAG: acyl-CoA dehydrogenase [Bryobacterales bacterium]|nr:acyl-CoA dehydrogenase [Bryobacterales bacterium]